MSVVGRGGLPRAAFLCSSGVEKRSGSKVLGEEMTAGDSERGCKAKGSANRRALFRWLSLWSPAVWVVGLSLPPFFPRCFRWAWID